MKAIVVDRYGSPDVMRLEEVEAPVPDDDSLLVRVRAAALNPYDWHCLRGIPYFMRFMFGLRGPKSRRLGLDFAGTVEAAGASVSGLAAGDAVFGMRGGSLAELLAVRADAVARKPESLDFVQAASLPLAGLTALQGLRAAGGLRAGQEVLIIGASGGVGTLAVQLAREMGARVTGVCSAANVELVRSLGAQRVVDYTREDYAQSGTRYDRIFQLAGTDSPARCRRALTPQGTLVLSSGDSNGRWLGPLVRFVQGAALSPFVGQTLVGLGTKNSRGDLERLSALVAEGKLGPVIDRTHPLAEAAEAMRYLETGRARGKVVVEL
jgi:NADPH:quinone reductase-like Zn-dependent oxidoreductase